MKIDSDYIVEDNLELLKSIDKESVDMVYVDPPFYKNRDFDDFDDRWKDINFFLKEIIEPVVKEIFRVLKNDGILVFHCDISASHYIKILLDDHFGRNRLVNEVIWKFNGSRKTKKKMYKIHDTIFIYSKSNKYTFNPVYKPYDETYFTKNKPKFCGNKKEYYVTTAAHNSQPDVIKRKNLRYEWNGHQRQWYVSKEKMQWLHEDNRLVYNKNGIPRIKRFLNEMDGIPVNDVWDDVSSIQKTEKVDYATQKPLKLLERIIYMFSNENDLIMDCFAGSGTTGVAAKKLNRKFLLIDKNSKGKKIFDERIGQIEKKDTLDILFK